MNTLEKYFLNILGVRVEDIQKNNGALIHQINYSVLSRWDVWSQTTQYTSLKYSFSKFGSVVKGKPIYGANCKGIKKKSDVRYIRITDINEDGSLNDDFVSAEVVEEKYLLEENDFLIARSGNTVGKTFLYKPNMGKCIFAGYLVKYIENVLMDLVLLEAAKNEFCAEEDCLEKAKQALFNDCSKHKEYQATKYTSNNMI